jgi:hypothetical protein
MLGHFHGLTTTTSCRQDKRAESRRRLIKSAPAAAIRR